MHDGPSSLLLARSRDVCWAATTEPLCIADTSRMLANHHTRLVCAHGTLLERFALRACSLSLARTVDKVRYLPSGECARSGRSFGACIQPNQSPSYSTVAQRSTDQDASPEKDPSTGPLHFQVTYLLVTCWALDNTDDMTYSHGAYTRLLLATVLYYPSFLQRDIMARLDSLHLARSWRNKDGSHERAAPVPA